jgi:4-oxalocrotonate tautomerase
MPLIRIDMFRGKPAAYRIALRDIVCETLGDAAGVLAHDRHAVVIEHEPDNLDHAPNFYKAQRNSDSILVTIMFYEGLALDQKRALCTAIIHALQQRVGLHREDIALNLLGSEGE